MARAQRDPCLAEAVCMDSERQGQDRSRGSTQPVLVRPDHDLLVVVRDRSAGDGRAIRSVQQTYVEDLQPFGGDLDEDFAALSRGQGWDLALDPRIRRAILTQAHG